MEGFDAEPVQSVLEQDADRRSRASKRENDANSRRLRTALDRTGKLVDVVAQTRSIGRQGVFVELQITLVGNSLDREHFGIVPLARLDERFFLGNVGRLD